MPESINYFTVVNPNASTPGDQLLNSLPRTGLPFEFICIFLNVMMPYAAPLPQSWLAPLVDNTGVVVPVEA